MLNHYEEEIIFENVHIRYHGNGPYMEVSRCVLREQGYASHTFGKSHFFVSTLLRNIH